MTHHSQAVRNLIIHQSWLLRQARRLIGPNVRTQHSPEDLVQDVLTLALQRRESASDGSGLRAWLRSAMRTRATELGRRAQYRIVAALPDVQASSKITPSRLAALSEEKRKLRDLVLDLDARTRRIVLMRVVDDLSFAEIALKEGLREDNARAIFSRAASKLRTRMPAQAV